MYGQLQESVEVGEVEEESFRENSRYTKNTCLLLKQLHFCGTTVKIMWNLSRQCENVRSVDTDRTALDPSLQLLHLFHESPVSLMLHSFLISTHPLGASS